ncbi:hypothetical protein DSO57_1037745 [Entomophthora muscae]|uniref:Uncharacterized protein n=1 Tax=Entomophthora muscae TaxID=34485 RepID=A0ACC2TX67_9FUNG|nr:hypothetical protein DSO57_1037745 [Entomophthora muscae]
MDAEDTFDYVILIVKDILNAISSIAALTVALLILGSTAIDKKSMDRVSVRITLVISILDFLYAIIVICFMGKGLEGLDCIVSDVVAQWLSLSYLFLNTSIAVNLHLIFVCGYASNPVWEKIYWAVSFGLSTVLSLIPIGNL